MKTAPAGLDPADLIAALRNGWGFEADRLEHLPLGFGSFHWKATNPGGDTRFVTVDDLATGAHGELTADQTFANLEKAFRTASALREQGGLEFVIAPLPDRAGAVARRLGARYAVTVFAYLEGLTHTHGEYESGDERREVAKLLGRLHSATRRLQSDLPRVDDFVFPKRASLEEALLDLDREWTAGPLSEAARDLLGRAARGVSGLLETYDRRVEAIGDTGERWVITHGEPHRANFIRPVDGLLRLIDWDTVLLAPPERDLWMVLGDSHVGRDEYVGAAGPVELDRGALELYRRRWALTDVAIYVDRFRSPHGLTEDDLASWKYLVRYLSEDAAGG